MMPDDREKVFAAIRRGLRGSEEPTTKTSARSPLRTAPAVDFETSFKKFSLELKELGGEVVVSSNTKDMAKFISSRIGRTESKRDIFLYAQLSYLQPLLKAEGLTAGDSRSRSVKVAVSSCVACIAETGTVAIGNEARLPAALAEQLFVVCKRDNLIPSLDEFFTDRYMDFTGSNLFLITGPSRTADIEKELVVGVHGPKEVYVIFIEQ